MARSGPAFSARLRILRPDHDPVREAREERVYRLLAQVLADGKSARLGVEGRCMEPLIRAGDRVEIRPPETPRHGAVVLARNHQGDLVCHRLLARTGGRVWLAGDGSSTLEETSFENVLGVVVGVEREGASFRLDRVWMRPIDRLEAAFHRRAAKLRGAPTHRWVEGLRRRLLGLRGYVWAATRARRSGASPRLLPASSR